MSAQEIRIVAVGDIAMMKKPSSSLWIDPLTQADLCIANLEAPITKNGIPTEKFIRLKQPIETGNWLNELNIGAVSLANNHLLDWGTQGMESTFKELDRVGIKYAGAGKNSYKAFEPCILKVKNYRIAFISCSCTLPKGYQATSKSPGIAGVRIKTSFSLDTSLSEEQPGTPPLIHTQPIEDDIKTLEKVIMSAKEEFDLVILSIHWGIPPQWSSAYQGLISEYQRILAQRCTNSGVDIIIGHHAHAPFGMETFIHKDNDYH